MIVGIADDGYENDGDEETKAKDIANLLAKNAEILGVIGHFSSEATEAAAQIYEQNKLVVISPTSTAIRENTNDENSNQYNNSNQEHTDDSQNQNSHKVCLNSYVFRTAPNDSIAAQKLSDKIPDTINKIAIIYENNNVYSRSFKFAFKEVFGTDKVMTLYNGRSKEIISDSQSDPCNFSVPKNENSPVYCLNKVKNIDDHLNDNKVDALLLIPATKNTEKIEKLLKKNDQKKFSFKLFGSDSMYKYKYIRNEEGKVSKKTSEMLVSVAWHRSDNKCNEKENGQKRLECQAAKLFLPDNSQQKKKNYLLK